MPKKIKSITSPLELNNFNSIINQYHGGGCPCCGGGIQKGIKINVDWAPSSFGTVQQLATQLTSGFNEWSSSVLYEGYWNLDSSGTYPKDGEITFNVAGTSNVYTRGSTTAADTDGITDADYLDQIRESFKLLSLSTGITFTEVTGNSADIDFTDHLSGAYQRTITDTFIGKGSTPSTKLFYMDKAHVNIDLSGNYGLPSAGLGEFYSKTILHEIYHVLGLGHLGDYNGEVDFDTEAVFKNDHQNLSIMSYVNPADNPFVDMPNIAGGANSIDSTGMVVDFQAIDDLYAAFGYGSSKAFLGDTIYGFNTNITADNSKIWNQFTTLAAKSGYSIIDGGGTDTIDLSEYSASQILDLRSFDKDSTSTYFSNIAGTFNNLSIAPGTTIENAIGGSAADTITGNTAANSINGLAGNDTISGDAGNDTIDGGAGNDSMTGGAGDDTYVVDTAADVIVEVNGGGTDLIQAASTTAGTTFTAAANIENLTLTDTVANNATGNTLANTLTGNSAINVLTGEEENDTIFGLASDDTISGGAGTDTCVFV